MWTPAPYGWSRSGSVLKLPQPNASRLQHTSWSLAEGGTAKPPGLNRKVTKAQTRGCHEVKTVWQLKAGLEKAKAAVKAEYKPNDTKIQVDLQGKFPARTQSPSVKLTNGGKARSKVRHWAHETIARWSRRSRPTKRTAFWSWMLNADGSSRIVRGGGTVPGFELPDRRLDWRQFDSRLRCALADAIVLNLASSTGSTVPLWPRLAPGHESCAQAHHYHQNPFIANTEGSGTTSIKLVLRNIATFR